jgi:hypothetical protein
MQKVQKVQKTTERGGFCTSCSSCTLRNGCHIRGKAADFRYPGGHPNFAINPMNQHETRGRNLARPPKCGARTRAGTPCQRPALRGRTRCRLHGGLSPGAPRGPKNGNFKTGDWTAEAIEERKWLRSLVKSFAKIGDTE